MTPPRAERLIVLGIVGQYPLAGVAWQAIHYLVGLRALGWDVFYVEDSGAPPYDPRARHAAPRTARTPSRYVADVMRRIGLARPLGVRRTALGGPVHGLDARAPRRALPRGRRRS